LCFLSGAEFNLGKVACLCIIVGVFVALKELYDAQSRELYINLTAAYTSGCVQDQNDIWPITQ
jgi:hypothetical protein